MDYNKENLKKLIHFVIELSNQPENYWFKLELTNAFATNNSNTLTSTIELSDVFKDLKRTKYFLKNIDKSHYSEGFKFYKNVSDKDLRLSLINDYKEMVSALLSKDFLEYSRKMSMQLERCFDFVINKTDAWTKVMENETLFRQTDFISGQYPINIKVKDGFFKPDYLNPPNKFRKEISEIEFKCKASYCYLFYQFDFPKHYSTFNEIYFLRNKASHCFISEKDSIKLARLISNVDEKQFYFNKTFLYIIRSLKDIF